MSQENLEGQWVIGENEKSFHLRREWRENGMLHIQTIDLQKEGSSVRISKFEGQDREDSFYDSPWDDENWLEMEIDVSGIETLHQLLKGLKKV